MEKDSYISAKNKFWYWQRKTKTLSMEECALFDYLFDANNRANWNDVFECKSIDICSDLQIKDKRKLKKIRNNLVSAGLITFSSGIGTEQTKYSLASFFEKIASAKIQPTAQKSKNSPDITINFAIGYNQPMEKWVRYKKDRGERFKSEEAILACYNLLYEMSGGNWAEAQKIVDFSMANNYKKLVKIEDKANNNNNRKAFDEKTLKTVVNAGFALHAASQQEEQKYKTAAERGRDALRGVAERVLAKYQHVQENDIEDEVPTNNENKLTIDEYLQNAPEDSLLRQYSKIIQ